MIAFLLAQIAKLKSAVSSATNSLTTIQNRFPVGIWVELSNNSSSSKTITIKSNSNFTSFLFFGANGGSIIQNIQILTTGVSSAFCGASGDELVATRVDNQTMELTMKPYAKIECLTSSFVTITQ